MVIKTQVGRLVAVAYRRVSSAEQARAERHVSLEVQITRTEQYIQGKGYELARTFTDVASGRRDDRAQYQAMLEYVRSGGASLIVTQFLDRFGRNPKEILRRYWELAEMGVKVECSDEDVSQELVLLVRAGIAGAESKRIGERVRHTIRRAVETRRMKPGIAPFGYRAYKEVDAAGKVATRFRQDTREAEAIREMYRLTVEENYGLKRIADALNTAGYRSRNGKLFYRNNVRFIVLNPALAGRFEYGKLKGKDTPDLPLVKVEGMFPAILSGDEWAKLQARLELRRTVSPRGKGSVSAYLLSGLARCGECGGAMAGHTGSGGRPGKRHPYRSYRCVARTAANTKCPTARHHEAVKLEQSVLDYLGQFSDAATVREYLSAAAQPKAKQTDELRRVEKQLANLDADFHKNLDLLKRGILEEAEFNRANVARRQERAAAEGRRATLAQEAEAAERQRDLAAKLPERVRSFMQDFKGLEVRRQKALLQTILKAVHVHADGRIELEFRGEGGEDAGAAGVSA